MSSSDAFLKAPIQGIELFNGVFESVFLWLWKPEDRVRLSDNEVHAFLYIHPSGIRALRVATIYVDEWRWDLFGIFGLLPVTRRRICITLDVPISIDGKLHQYCYCVQKPGESARATLVRFEREGKLQ